MSFTLQIGERAPAFRLPATDGKTYRSIGCNVKWEGRDAHWMPAEACDLV